MSALDDFLNLFADPNAVFRQQDIEGRLATARSLSDLLSQGVKTPFEAELFPGEAPIQGLSTARPATQQDLITTLLQSQSPEFAGQGVNLAMQALQQQGQRDIAARAREVLTKPVENLRASGANLTPQTQFLLDILQSGLPMAQEAFKQLGQQFQPFTLGQGQTRFGGLGAQIAKAGVDPTKKMEAEEGLRKEFTSRVKNFTEADEAMSRIRALGTSESSPATDNSLLFQYARLLSPGIVTEEDFNNAKRSGGEGWRGTIQTFFNQMVNGKLPDSVRRNIVNASAVQYAGERELFNQRKKDYTDLAIRNDLNAGNVTGPIKARTKIDDLLRISPNASIEPPPPPGYVRQ